MQQYKQNFNVFFRLRVAIKYCLTSLVVLGENEWLRRIWYLLCKGAAFLIGSTYEDERIAFSKPHLIKNDAYRDRLLEPEIADFVDLCDALCLTIAQRKALFQCFLHVDFMRRSGVTRAELLRYCQLRATPLTNFLLPVGTGATHRNTSAMKKRWDISQFVAVCFSICTIDMHTLIQVAITEACRSQQAHSEQLELQSQGDASASEGEETMQPESCETDDLCLEIAKCIELFIGVTDKNEIKLLELLQTLYSSTTEGSIDFRVLHGSTSVLQVARLFPVLVFPCIWARHVLQVRTLGQKTWQILAERRRELQTVGMSDLFVSFSDIIAASKIHVHRKQQHQANFNLTACFSLWRTSKDSSSDTSVTTMSISAQSESQSRLVTPRKVLPSIDGNNAVGQKIFDALSSDQASDFGHYSNLEQAWRVTANNVLASTYLQYHCDTNDKVKPSTEQLQTIFHEVQTEIFACKIASNMCVAIQKYLIHKYGYQFASFLLEKSSLKDVCCNNIKSEEKRTQQRYEKAWRSRVPSEDKPAYWKEFVDPASKKAFYYNIRTGESRWDKPTNFVGKVKTKRAKKKGKRT